MLTTALQRLVIPVLQDAAKPGTLPNTILFLASNRYYSLPGAVVDYPRLRCLAIILSLPRAGRHSQSLTNTLNRKQLGKLTVDGQDAWIMCSNYLIPGAPPRLPLLVPWSWRW
jgi:hypothetical protein